MRKPAARFVALVTLAALTGGTAAAHARYVNPFADPRWEPGRIDMGMD